MIGCGQHCPVAKAAEVFDQLWTLLVFRELCRRLPSWFTLSHFSTVPRPAEHGTG